MRVRLFNKAISKGQLQTATQILDSLGKVIGESVETVNIKLQNFQLKLSQSNEDLGYIFKLLGGPIAKIFCNTSPYAL